MEVLAAKLEGVLSRISEGDIYMNSGRTWRGYREPEDAAAELFSEALQPFLNVSRKLLVRRTTKWLLLLAKP